mgnify:CR=1 FL=1
MVIKIFMGIETGLLVLFFIIEYMIADRLLHGMIDLFGDEIDRMYKELMEKEDK